MCMQSIAQMTLGNPPMVLWLCSGFGPSSADTDLDWGGHRFIVTRFEQRPADELRREGKAAPDTQENALTGERWHGAEGAQKTQAE